MNKVQEIYEIVYANFGQRNEYVSDSRSNEHYLKIPVQA